MNLHAGLAQFLLSNRSALDQTTAAGPLYSIADRQLLIGGTSQPYANYEISAPTFDYGNPVHEQQLLKHEIADSWGKPFSVKYHVPPTEFTHVKLNLSVSTFGVQYDRLAHIYLHGTEIWRPSMSEPRGLNCSVSQFIYDTSTFLALFTQSGSIAFSLDNLLTSRLNGTFSVELNAQFFNSDEPVAPQWYNRDAPHVIEPVVGPIVVATDAVKASIKALHRNTTRAIINVYATGNGNDEFWYALTSSDEDGRTGPQRHVLVFINGELAGSVLPFYEIYTGGIQPALWAPFVAVNTYESPSYQVDITAFLPDLWESDAQLTLQVLDSYANQVHREWILSAALFMWQTEGVSGSGVRQPVNEKNETSSVLVGGALEVHSFQQNLTVSADLTFSGETVHVEWAQQHLSVATLTDTTTVTHNSDMKSQVTYGAQNYSTNQDCQLVLVLDDDEVVVVQGYDISDYSSNSQEIQLDRTSYNFYNGSWKAYHAPNETVVKHQSHVNGSDVFVKYYDRVLNSAYLQHAISRNGSVVTLFGDETEYHPAASMPRVANARFFPRTDIDSLVGSQKVRQKWLKHQL